MSMWFYFYIKLIFDAVGWTRVSYIIQKYRELFRKLVLFPSSLISTKKNVRVSYFVIRCGQVFLIWFSENVQCGVIAKISKKFNHLITKDRLIVLKKCKYLGSKMFASSWKLFFLGCEVRIYLITVSINFGLMKIIMFFSFPVLPKGKKIKMVKRSKSGSIKETTEGGSKTLVCCFCGLKEDNELVYGKFYQHSGYVTHYYCLVS